MSEPTTKVLWMTFSERQDAQVQMLEKAIAQQEAGVEANRQSVARLAALTGQEGRCAS